MGAKIICNLKGISRMLTPRAFTQLLLKRKIESIFKLDDKTLESIASRVAHYHKINERFEIAPFADSRESAPSASFVSSRQRLSLANPHFGLLKDNKLSKEHSSVYFYDSYEWTRYFPDSYRWYYEFGDVNYYLTAPAITKTRPIDARVGAGKLDSGKLDSNALDSSARESSRPESSLQDSASQNYSPPPHSIKTAQNSIILQLEKNRHFSFIHDPIAFEDKKDILFFRGACPQKHRSDFLQKYFAHPLCDLGHTGGSSEHPAYTKPKISKESHLGYKFLLSLEGNDVASNLKWVLASNSLCVMPTPKYESWFMEEKLLPNVHYAHISDDYENVEEVLEFFIKHPKDAKDIVHNAHQYCARFRNPRIEAACNLLVLRKYFYLSAQCELTSAEKSLLGL